MADNVFDQIHAESKGSDTQSSSTGNVFDQIHAENKPDDTSVKKDSLAEFGKGVYDSTVGGLVSTAKALLPKFHTPEEEARISKEHADLLKQGNYSEAAKGIVKDALSRVPGGNILTGIIHSSIDQAHKAKDAYDRGDVAGTLLHATSAIPGPGTLAAQGVDSALGQEAKYDKFGNVVQEAEASNPANAAGQAIGMAALTAAPQIVSGASKVSGTIGKVAAAISGKMTGVGSDAIEQAVKSPEVTREYMRNPDPIVVRQHLVDALQDVRDSRADQYSQDLAKVSSQGQPAVDPTTIKAALDQKLQQFRVGKVPAPPSKMTPVQYKQWQATYGGKTPGDLDFSNSPIGQAGQGDIKQVNDLVSNWTDWTPMGADALKRRIDDLYTQSGQARALTTGLRNEVKDAIVAQVPEYGTMTKNYADTSRFLDSLKDLSLDSKNPGTSIRKMTTLLNQNNSYRKMLVEALEPYSGIDHSGEIAGVALSPLMPRGIMGPASGFGLMADIMSGGLSPKAALALSTTSPRVIGELATAIGTVKPYLKAASATASKAGPTLAIAAQSPTDNAAPPTEKPTLPVRVGDMVNLKGVGTVKIKSYNPDTGELEY